ncbi:hypothetical protein [Roseateles aquatilis]|uniref:hypothetical protein n=1 Tax=Roseateles aquatilis TaxID=431061 RepID=UPI001390310F|nr:hypothetical protein [Roseateles aquatilis]
MFDHVGVVAGVESVSVSEHGQDCSAAAGASPAPLRYSRVDRDASMDAWDNGIDITRGRRMALAREQAIY